MCVMVRYIHFVPTTAVTHINTLAAQDNEDILTLAAVLFLRCQNKVPAYSSIEKKKTLHMST